MKIMQYDLTKITEYPGNAKEHPQEQIDKIKESISQFGFRTPILIDKDGVIIQGHGRYISSRQLGLKKVPVIIADDLSPEKVKMLRLADNKVAESEWNNDALNTELKDLVVDFDIEDFGFDLDFTNEPEDISAQITTEQVTPYQKYHFLISVDYVDSIVLKEKLADLLETLDIEVVTNESSN